MDEKKEYLNEERYQKTKRKFITLALVVLLIGLISGGLLIKLGITRSNEANLNELRAQKTAESRSNGFSARYYELDNKINRVEMAPLFYILGGFIVITTSMISGSIYVFTKRREITAFTAQQVMPVAKEGIDEMAPTVGSAAKEVAKGIKEGLNEADSEEKADNVEEEK